MKPVPIILATLLAVTAGAATDPAPQNKAGYIAHEWGTFTSVQGFDGIQLEWNPSIAEALPKFVYDVLNPTAKKGVARTNPLLVAKIGVTSRQRMETPVIYFYTDKPQKVSVEVKFPGGMFTEWYPQLTAPVPNFQPVPLRGGSMKWNEVELLPGNGADEMRHFPKDEGGSHYYAARETDASGLKVKGAGGADEYEKFLFYRGVAGFQAPLFITQIGERGETARLENRGAERIGAFFFYSVRGGKAAFVKSDALEPKSGAREIALNFEQNARPLAETRANLRREMREALTSAGLYEREASAMVKTWDDSWFGEEGTRVLYLLPHKWSDTILPLTLSPAPSEIKRVFVGRAELITPAQERAVLQEVKRYAEGGTEERKAAVAAVSALNLGRFSEAMYRRLTTNGQNTNEFIQVVWALLDASRSQRRVETASR